MNKREKLLFGTTALLGAALGVSLHKGAKHKKQLKEITDVRCQLLEKLKYQEAELLQKRGNMHFIKNCLSIIKSFAEDAEDCSNKEEYWENVSRANRNTIQSLELVQPLLEHLTYSTNNISSSLFDELKHLKVFMAFVKIRSENNLRINYKLDDSVKPYIRHNICCCLLSELLENAYTHSDRSGTDNMISIKAKVADDYLVYDVSNSISKSKKVEGSRPGGMGLENIRERLALFYQNDFEVSSMEKNNRYEFKLIVKLIK